MGKVKFYFFIPLLFSATALAEIDSCDYDAKGGDFIVIDNGERKVKFVDRDFRWSVIACTWNFAALYDGDDLYVYSAAGRGFEQTSMVDDNYKRGEIATGENGILFYDGDDLHSYCGSKFSRSFMVDDNAEARSEGNGRVARMRVGNDHFRLNDGCEIVK